MSSIAKMVSRMAQCWSPVLTGTGPAPAPATHIVLQTCFIYRVLPVRAFRIRPLFNWPGKRIADLDLAFDTSLTKENMEHKLHFSPTSSPIWAMDKDSVVPANWDMCPITFPHILVHTNHNLSGFLNWINYRLCKPQFASKPELENHSKWFPVLVWDNFGLHKLWRNLECMRRGSA